MKVVIIFIAGWIFFSSHATAQTFSEWFFQNKTELKYLGKQIAALQVYIEVVEKGYGIVRTGTNIIGAIKRGDLYLHADYFNSLKAVKPEVRDFINSVEAEWLKNEVKRVATNTENEASSSTVCSANEVKAIRDVLEGIVSTSSETWNAFQQVMSNGTLEMTDAARISRSAALIRALTEQYNTALTFSHAVDGICQGRLHEQFDVQTGKTLIGNK